MITIKDLDTPTSKIISRQDTYIGVKNDANYEKRIFKIPKIYRGIDITSDYVFILQVQPPDKTIEPYLKPLIKDIDEDSILLTWNIDRVDCLYDGELEVSILIRNIDEEIIKQTYICKFIVERSINATKEPPIVDKNIFEDYVALAAKYAQDAKDEVNKLNLDIDGLCNIEYFDDIEEFLQDGDSSNIYIDKTNTTAYYWDNVKLKYIPFTSSGQGVFDGDLSDIENRLDNLENADLSILDKIDEASNIIDSLVEAQQKFVEDYEDLDAKIPTKTSELVNDSGFITLDDIDGLSSDGIEEAPVDGKQYVRKDADWEELVVESGGFDGAGGTTDDIVFAEDLKFMGTSVGNYPDGTTIVKDTTLSSFFKGMVQKQIPPVYSQPTITISGSTPLSVEIGTNITPVITASFIQNHAGAITNYNLKKASVSVLDVANTQTFTDTQFQITGNVAFSATASYGNGVILKDNFGVDYPTGRIMAGSKASNTVTYTTYRRAFYQAFIGDTTVPTTSAEIRVLTGSLNNPANGNTISLPVPIGVTKIVISYPSNLRDITSIMSSALSMNIRDAFTLLTINVEGAGSYSPTPYKTYLYIPAIPYGSTDTLTITI